MEVIDGNHTLIINPEKSCRLCLAQSSDLLNIFSSLIVDGFIVSVVEMLAYTINITVSVNNRLLPKQICNDCQKQIVAFYTFKQKMKRMEQSLNSILSIPEIDPPEIDVFQGTDNCDAASPEYEIDSHSKLIELDVLEVKQNIDPSIEENVIEICSFEAPNCDKTFINMENNAESHDMLFVEEVEKEGGEKKDSTIESSQPLRRRDHTDRNVLEQRTFGTECSAKSTLKSSLEVCCANVNENNVDELNDGNNSEFINFNHHAMHLITKHFDFFPCHNCCLLFISNEKLNEHCIRPHHEANLGIAIKSYASDYTFLDESNILKVYSCGECGKSFSTVSKLKSHVVCHASKFDCPIENCGSQYNHMARLSIHVCKKHINMNHQICFHCNQTFKSYIDLQQHIKNSCKAKIFECFECDKKFYSEKALAQHLKNIGGKNFKCDTCGKDFKQQSELTIHMRSHTNERPFQCTICNKSYKTSSMRAVHMDSHINGKTFKCHVCNKNLQSRESFRSHMKRHTEGKKHACDYCGKKFFSKYHMRLHQSNTHRPNVSIKQPEIQDNNNDNLNQIMNDGDLAKFIDDGDIINFFL